MIYLIHPGKKQYKANLHCHTVLSDGHATPEEVKEMYKSHGYDILCITDHERPTDHSGMSEDGFLMINGYEAYVRPDRTCYYNLYDKEIHMCLYARDPHNTTMICPNYYYTKYFRRDGQEDKIVGAGPDSERIYSREYINEFIRIAKENGYLVAYNHPYWSMESEEDVLSYEGYFSLEIVNYASQNMSGLEHAGAIYDKMLNMGKRVFCHGADDNHNAYPEGDYRCDSFGAFTMIMPESLTYGSVIDAMERGEMYSSMGPIFKEVSIEGNKVHIECSEVAHIHVYVGNKSPKFRHAAPGENITSADIEIDPRAKYVRVSICDREGRWADTRGFFRDEIGFEGEGGDKGKNNT